MAYAHCSAMYINLPGVQPALLDICKSHHAECFIHFKHCHIILANSSLFQTLGHSQGRGNSEVNGSTGSIGKTCNNGSFQAKNNTFYHKKKLRKLHRLTPSFFSTEYFYLLIILAKGFSPCFCATLSVVKTSAQAPSLRVLAFAAVTVPTQEMRFH